MRLDTRPMVLTIHETVKPLEKGCKEASLSPKEKAVIGIHLHLLRPYKDYISLSNPWQQYGKAKPDPRLYELIHTKRNNNQATRLHAFAIKEDLQLDNKPSPDFLN